MSPAGQTVPAEDHPVSRFCVPVTLSGTDQQLNPILNGYGGSLGDGLAMGSFEFPQGV